MRKLIILATWMLVLIAANGLTALGSTVSVSTAYGIPGDTAVLVTVSLDNSSPFAGSELTLQYNSSMLDLNRIDPAPRLIDQSEMGYYEYTNGKVAVVVFDISGVNLPADTGIILNIYFDIPLESTFGEAEVAVSEMTAVFDDLQYDTVTVEDGTFYVWAGYFCGDVDNNLSTTPDISDLIYLVQFMFQGGPDPLFMETANVDCAGSSEDIDIADLIHLVNYMFQEGPELDCPPCDGIMSRPRTGNHSGICGLSSEYLTEKQGRLSISGDFTTEILGYHQRFKYDADEIRVDSIVSGPGSSELTLYSHAGNGEAVLGLVDLHGEGVIQKGSSEIASVFYTVIGDRAGDEEPLAATRTEAADRQAQLVQMVVESGKSGDGLPRHFALHQNYPNPFNASTLIQYDLPKPSEITIKIFNVLGQTVRTLVSGRQPAGFHQIRWDGKDGDGNTTASGVYLYRLSASDFTSSKKMLLLK